MKQYILIFSQTFHVSPKNISFLPHQYFPCLCTIFHAFYSSIPVFLMLTMFYSLIMDSIYDVSCFFVTHQCFPSFTHQSFLHVIIDINECSGTDTIIHDCDQGSPNSDNKVTQALCRNSYGSYECYCLPGWTFNEQRRVCESEYSCMTIIHNQLEALRERRPPWPR